MNDWAGVAARRSAVDAGRTAGRDRGLTAIATGTAPAIGDPPLSAVGTAGCPEGPTNAEGAAADEVLAPPVRRRPIAKKHANTKTNATESATPCPLRVAPGPPMRTPSQ